MNHITGEIIKEAQILEKEEKKKKSAFYQCLEINIGVYINIDKVDAVYQEEEEFIHPDDASKYPAKRKRKILCFILSNREAPIKIQGLHDYERIRNLIRVYKTEFH